jgi:long-chain fatty acid transport protein
MKKQVIIGVLVLCCASPAGAAIVTSFSQSALYFRLLSRNASTDLDAAYYNPAGLTHLKDGFHIALHNQTVIVERTVVNDFALLNNPRYLGKVFGPFLPNFYAIYKKGPLALSFGCGFNAGGVSADYERGLPSFETGIASLPALLTLTGLPTTAYSADIDFKGLSAFPGFQANFSYAFNTMVSAAAGLRYIYAVNTFEGHIENIQINPVFPALGWSGQMRSAPSAFEDLHAVTGDAAFLGLAAATSDKTVDAKQTGSGFTPILSLHLRPVEALNISAKYEFKTKLELTNTTTIDDTGMFPDGVKRRNDIPAILSLGAEYALIPRLRASVSFNYTFDKDANWESREKLVDSNSWEFGTGVEYDVTKSIALSAGYLRMKYGLGADYQQDSTFLLSNHCFGVGGRIRLREKLDIDIGGMLMNYQDFSKTISYGLLGSSLEKYELTTFGFSIGLGYHF